VYQQSPWGVWSGVQLVHMAYRLPEFDSISNFHAVFVYQGQAGKLNVRGDGRQRRIPLVQDEISFAPADCAFHSEPEDMVMESVGLIIDPHWLQGLGETTGLSKGRLSLRPALGERNTRMAEILKLLNDDLRQNHPFGRVYGDSLLAALGTALISHLTPAQTAEPAGPLTSRQLQLVTSYIHDSLAKEIRLRDVATLVGYSEFHFHRLFSRTTGMRLHEFITQARLEQAERLLRQSDFSVGQIAAEVGFSDAGHLSRHMRRRRGLSPSEFRAQRGK
jgi:AraC family transcriptional regulator